MYSDFITDNTVVGVGHVCAMVLVLWLIFKVEIPNVSFYFFILKFILCLNVYLLVCRLTFLICSVGFTSPMLFDERKQLYHLMLHKFLACGAQQTFFE